MKKKFLILFPIFLILGCGNDKKEIENFAPKPCIRKYPDTAYGEWKTICEKAPFIDGTIIPQNIFSPLREVGFLCEGHLFPSAKEINLICDDIDKYK